MATENPPFTIQADSHGAELFRLAVASLLPSGIGGLTNAVGGIVAAGDLAVTAGTGNTVNVAKGQVWIPGTSGAHQSLYYAFNDASVALTTTPNGSNPMYYLICAAVNDQAYANNPSGVSNNTWGLIAVAGTPAASPTVPATPYNSYPIAKVLVPASASSSSTYTITNLSATIGTQVFAPGDYKLAASSTAQAGWLYCDGSSYSTSTYANLFANIGYNYGGAGASFNVPDWRGRAPFGAGSVGSNAQPTVSVGGNTANGIAGEAAHTLSTGEIPGHTHNVTVSGGGTTSGQSNSHNHNFPSSNILTFAPSSLWVNNSGTNQVTGITGLTTSGASADHSHTVSFSSSGTTDGGTGGGQAHNNIPPMIGVAVFIKT